MSNNSVMGEEKIGTRLKRLREEVGLSQRQLAKRSGVDREYICQIEANTPKSPKSITIRTAKALARGLGKSPTVFLEDEYRETPAEILERLKLGLPFTIPIYEEFPLHAGEPAEAVEFASIRRDRARGKTLEGYISSGSCLDPDIKEGDIIIIDRGGQVNNGDIVACLINDQLHLARLRKIADEIWVENNHGSRKLEECKLTAPVIEIRRRLK